MLMFALVRGLAVLIPWLLNLAIWAVARSFNMPEPAVHDAGAFVFAQVEAIENRVGKALYATRLSRWILSWLRCSLNR